MRAGGSRGEKGRRDPKWRTRHLNAGDGRAHVGAVALGGGERLQPVATDTSKRLGSAKGGGDVRDLLRKRVEGTAELKKGQTLV
eukprot:1537599-Pleurochrysis_carterae.AAC.2